MPNFLENLRMRNLFDPSAMNNPATGTVDFSGGPPPPPMTQPYQNISFGPTTVPMPQPTADEGFDPAAMMAQLYSPEHEASDRFNQLASAYPQFEKPSGLRRVGGSILGALTDLGTNFGGNKTGIKGTSVFDEATGKNKYYEAIENWKNQVPPAQAAANLERSNNMNERQMAYQTVQGELANRRDTAKNKNAEEANRIRADRAEVYRMKSMMPNYKFTTNGPTVMMMDPQTGKVTDTGISTGSLSDADKLALQQEQALERITATGEQARETEGVRQTGRMEVVGARGEEARKTKGTPSATANAKNETPTQTKVRQYNAAKEFAARNPQLAKYIKFGKSNEFTISPPSKGGFFSSAGPSNDEYNKITAGIFGGDIPVPQPSRTGATPPSNTQTTTPSKQNQPTKKGVRVKDPSSGQTGTFNGTAEEAKKAGYTVIG